MSEQKSASETAEVTALLRAMSCFEADEKIRGRDTLAELFLADEKRKKLPGEAFRRTVLEKVKAGGLYEYVIARTAYFDCLFAGAVKEGLPQIVLLGAGYDSRAYRFPPGAAKVFEVDAPFTQERKISILKTQGVDHGQAVFVPVDFEKDDLFERLSESGYTPLQKTLFLLEGVALYLSPEAVDMTLRAIQGNAHGMLAFDYLNLPVTAEHGIVRKDERVLFGLPGLAIEAYLQSLDYKVLENIGADEMGARYLRCSDGKTFGAIKKTMNFMKAAM